MSLKATEINPFSTIPGLRWLGVINLPPLLLAIVTAVPFILAYLFTGMLIRPELGLQTLTWIFIAMHILTVTSWVHRAQGNLQDIALLLKLSGQQISARQLQDLQGEYSVNLKILVISVLFGAVFHFSGRVLGATATLDVVANEIVNEFIYFNAPPELLVWNYVALLQFFVIGLALIFGIVSQSRQNRVMNAICEKLEINLLNVDRLAVVGGPLLRALTTPIFLLAATGPLIFVNDGANADGFYLLAVPTALLLTAFALTSLPPMLTVRRKVISSKQQELSVIQRYLDGDKQAMAASQISHLQDSFTAVAVLDYRDRVNAIWEWPLHGQLLKLMFYLIIPPLAWAAAALVERVIDAALG